MSEKVEVRENMGALEELEVFMLVENASDKVIASALNYGNHILKKVSILYETDEEKDKVRRTQRNVFILAVIHNLLEGLLL